MNLARLMNNKSSVFTVIFRFLIKPIITDIQKQIT